MSDTYIAPLLVFHNVPFLVLFSFFEKTTYHLSYATSVRPSVEIVSFRGNSLPNKPIELKIGLNVREGGSACPKGLVFRNSNCKLQIYAICNFLQINLCARFY